MAKVPLLWISALRAEILRDFVVKSARQRGFRAKARNPLKTGKKTCDS